MFHPAVNDWFSRSFAAATPVQTDAWRVIHAGKEVLIAAPTGSGKTLAAFLCAINQLVEQAETAPLSDAVQVLYISPLKALSNDIEKNLQAPLAGVDEWLRAHRGRASGIRAMVRTGDTTPGEREQMRRRPPHILVTTPESLYLLLTSASGRAMLADVRDVIVDEIHAIATSKRGSHLALSLARLDALLPRPARRIGLSATQKPMADMASFLTGGRPCALVDHGHQRTRDLQLELPASPLSPVMAKQVWEEIYDRLQQLVEAHQTTLIFVNTRRMAERLARHLADRVGEALVTAHHGSLSRQHRLAAEQALKEGRLRALVATASLELGIDIGPVDLVCQIGSPGSISALIQRVGRAGHAVGETPKGRLFPVSRDDLVESVALLRAIGAGALDTLSIPSGPLDVLAQQVVAELAARAWPLADLFQVVRQAWPYRALERQTFEQVVDMLASGYATRRGRAAAYVYHDAVNGRLKARPAARLAALQNGGAIPDQFDYAVILQPQGFRVGTLNEDFAFESLPGDIFQLGNCSYRMLKIETGRVLVEDARGQPPSIPFWFGDAPGRSDELSAAVSRFRSEMQQRLQQGSPASVQQWLVQQGFAPDAAQQVTDYLAAVLAALGCIPTQRHMVLERFFDDTGDMHLILHAPLGSRIMRAWGLALRKRFCRHFNFELQAAALEDSLILSLGESHSFDNASVPAFLHSASVRQVLVQALLDAPMFAVRWRWNATIALAVQRMRNGQKVPPQWQRNQAEDLVAVVFPDQLACLENIRGEREIPDHPLVTQTIADCLHDSMDIAGLERVLQQREQGAIEIRCLDLIGPSPLSAEIINARPYAFLDDGAAENRRTRAISANPDDLSDAAALSSIRVSAIDQVRSECWISPRGPDELHDGLLQLGFLTQAEFRSGRASSGAAGNAAAWGRWFQSLADELRVSCVSSADGRQWWLATERLAEFLSLGHTTRLHPDPGPQWRTRSAWEREQAMVELLRSRLSGLGPVSEALLLADFSQPLAVIQRALAVLEQEGYAIRMPALAGGPAAAQHHWCERRLLARIHRYSKQQRRHLTKTVAPAAYMRFLVAWHGLDAPTATVAAALEQLQGWVAPLAAWEHGVLQPRCRDYSPASLEQMFLSGQLTWFRPLPGSAGRQQIIAATPICMAPRSQADCWNPRGGADGNDLGGTSQAIIQLLRAEGAMFTDDIARRTGLLQAELEAALGTLVGRGLVTADAFSPLRWLIRPEAQKRRRIRSLGRRSGNAAGDVSLLGRWSAVRPAPVDAVHRPDEHLAMICASLLRRYGVVFRAVLERESLLPAWRHLLSYLRRMEDRGEVRGGRFVDGFSGEQFALHEALGLLHRQAQPDRPAQSVVIAAADPLNLGGIITPGVRTPSLCGNRILLQSGVPVARMLGDEVEILHEKSVVTAAQARQCLATTGASHRPGHLTRIVCQPEPVLQPLH